jgi:hypothetical protein
MKTCWESHVYILLDPHVNTREHHGSKIVRVGASERFEASVIYYNP